MQTWSVPLLSVVFQDKVSVCTFALGKTVNLDLDVLQETMGGTLYLLFSLFLAALTIVAQEAECDKTSTGCYWAR